MLTQDPIGLAGGVNLYAYAGNNPTSFSDPWGLCPVWLDGKPCGSPSAATPYATSAGSREPSGLHGSEFGLTRTNDSKFHSGLDWAAPRGTNVLAAGGGTATYTHSVDGGMGVTLDLGNGAQVETLHMDSVDPSLLTGKSIAVEAGQVLGTVGRTGNVGPKNDDHIHVKTKVNGRYVNPRDFFSTTAQAGDIQYFNGQGQPTP